MSEVFVSPAKVMSGALGDCAQPILLDCRSRIGQADEGRRLFDQEHIAGARFADLDQDLANLALGAGRHPLPRAKDFISACESWGIGSGSSTPVVVYDDMSGAIAARAWWMLRWIGVREAYILDGGIDAWRAAGGAMSQANDEPQPRVTQPATAAGHMPVMSVDELQGWITGDHRLLLDARAGDRFRGEVEPIDPVAGHVPGASNRPFSESLENGVLMAEESLRGSWQQTLGATSPDQVVHMCGSGVTACFNLACMEHLGLSGSSLYVGSWSEWISNPANNVATGVGT